VEYYRTPEGKYKKNLQNSKRGKGEAKPECGDRPGKTVQEMESEMGRLDAGMLGYVQMVTSLMEGRRVSRDEIVRMLARAVRQHSMVPGLRIDYVLQYLKKKAP
jgi:hypothetical protein